MKRPTTLYRFCVNHRLEKHKITQTCNPQFEKLTPEGELFRCRHGYSDFIPTDFYGWSTRHAAEYEEVISLSLEIGELKVKRELLVEKLAKRRRDGTKKD